MAGGPASRLARARAALVNAGCARFLILTQCRNRPPRYRLSRCFETMPSSPIRQAWRNRSRPISPCSKSLRKIPSTRRASSRERLALRMGGVSSPSLTRMSKAENSTSAHRGRRRSCGYAADGRRSGYGVVFPDLPGCTSDGAHPRRGFAARHGGGRRMGASCLSPAPAIAGGIARR